MLPNAVQVVPTGEGCEGAALAPVAVGAHQAVGADPVPEHHNAYTTRMLQA